MECLRCQGLTLIDPLILKWILATINTFNREEMGTENLEKLDMLLNLLDSMSL